MQVKVLATFFGAEDGVKVVEYRAGEVIEIKEDFARGLIEAGRVEPLDKPKAKRKADEGDE